LKDSAKLYSIQYLRALAAAAVVLSHAADSLLGRSSRLIDLGYGADGVDIFFVVSGFIMYYTTFDTEMGPKAFLSKRLIRIFPLYFILSSAMFVLTRLHPASFNRESPNLLAYLESVLFIPHWNPREHDLQPIIGQGWTLNYEMFFYVVFAASLLLGKSLRGIAVLPVMVALVVLGSFCPVDSPVFITYTSPLMLEFCLGIIIAACFLGPRKLAIGLSLSLVVVLVVAAACLYRWQPNSYASLSTRALFAGLPCGLLVAIMVSIERRGWLPYSALLVVIGDASYSLYLDHGFVLGFGRRLWLRYFTSDTIASHALFIAFILTVSILLAIPLYKYVEIKLGRMLKTLLVRPSQGSSPIGHTKPAMSDGA
jgi:exopolysaccharide production protein ExoZ